MIRFSEVTAEQQRYEKILFKHIIFNRFGFI